MWRQSINFPTIFLLFSLCIYRNVVICGKNPPPKAHEEGGANEEHHYDAIVVGAGIIGSGIAYKLAMDGKRTLLVEKEKLGHNNGSSHGKSRIIRYTHSDPMWLPLVHDAYAEWDELAKKAGNTLMVQNGLLTMDTEDEKTATRIAVLDAFNKEHENKLKKNFQIPYKKFVGKEITDNFPHLQNYDKKWTDQNDGKVKEWSAVYEISGATLLADHCLKALQDLFKATKKGFVMEEAEVTLTTPLKDHVEVTVVEKKGKTHIYRAKHVVFALGGWLASNKFLKDLPHETEVADTQVRVLGSFFWDINEDSRQYYQPDVDPKDANEWETVSSKHNNKSGKHKSSNNTNKNKNIAAVPAVGGSQQQQQGVHKNPPPKYPSPTLLITNPPNKSGELEELYAIPGIDYPNKIKFCIHKGLEVKGEIKPNVQRERETRKARWMVEIPRRHLLDHLPGVRANGKPADETTCIYTMTKDEKFIVDRHPKHRNVFIAGGFSGTGFKFGPTVGKLIVHLINNNNQQQQQGEKGKQEIAAASTEAEIDDEGSTSSGKQTKTSTTPPVMVPLADGLQFDVTKFSLHREMKHGPVTLR